MNSTAKSSPLGFDTMSSALPDAENYHRWILSLLAPWLRGEAMEVGVGYGQYTGEIAGRVDRLIALDRDPDCVARLCDKGSNVIPIVGDLADPRLPEHVGEGKLDVVICLNVLEHLKDDERTLSILARTLRPGGVLLLIVPAHPSLYGPMDAMAGHFRRYRAGELRDRLLAAGYGIRRLRYVNPIGGLGWWVNARFFRPKHLSDEKINRQIRLFDRYLLPLSSRLSGPFARIFGQSLWSVAEKL